MVLLIFENMGSDEGVYRVETEEYCIVEVDNILRKGLSD
jgi:hypothetical protein